MLLRVLFITATLLLGGIYVAIGSSPEPVVNLSENKGIPAHGFISRVEQNKYIEEEALVLKAMMLRIRALQEKTGIMFSRTPLIRVHDVVFVYGDAMPRVARYDFATGTIAFSASDFDFRGFIENESSEKLDFEALAEDKKFQMSMDHELGHALTDQVSRRIGIGPLFREWEFEKFSIAQNIGYNARNEGIGEWFKHLLNPTETWISKDAFPTNYEESRRYSNDMIFYSGGHWMVRDILDRHGEEGLIWLVMHPPSLDEKKMRADAVAYRARALIALGG